MSVQQQVNRRAKVPVVVVSGDTHIGPRLKEDLRPYCPKQHLAAFDDFVEHKDELLGRGNRRMFGGEEAVEGELALAPKGLIAHMQRNAQTAGHYDVHVRLKDYNRDGVSAGVLIHGSQNGEPIPFRTSPFESMNVGDDPEMGAIGYHIYNRWLADQCTIEPERHVGVAYVPLWDIDAAVQEMEWARTAGLKAVYFPAPMAGIPEYNRREWEPFYSAAESLGMPLIGHGGQDLS
jgi:predicted TIM-barrel fold metal-dependent hydrolase